MKYTFVHCCGVCTVIICNLYYVTRLGLFSKFDPPSSPNQITEDWQVHFVYICVICHVISWMGHWRSLFSWHCSCQSEGYFFFLFVVYVLSYSVIFLFFVTILVLNYIFILLSVHKLMAFEHISWVFIHKDIFIL